MSAQVPPFAEAVKMQFSSMGLYEAYSKLTSNPSIASMLYEAITGLQPADDLTELAEVTAETLTEQGIDFFLNVADAFQMPDIMAILVEASGSVRKDFNRFEL